MKVVSKFLILLVLAMPFVAFTGCSDDDDDSEDYAASIAGTYNGQLKTETGDVYMAETIIKIERTGENVATLSTTMEVDLSKYGMGTQTLDIKCANSTVGKNADNKYTITGTTTVLTIGVAINGTIDSAGAATINIDVNATTPPLDLTFIFSGTKAK